jgi:hypothetical protein
VDLFPALPDALPKLNLAADPAPEVEIRWPEDPRAQIFWPAEQAAHTAIVEQPVQAPTAELPPAAFASATAQPAPARNPDPAPEPALAEVERLKHDPIYLPRDPRFEPRFALEDVPSDHPLLIFSDPSPAPPPEPEPEPEAVAAGDGRFSRLANHASAFAERLPDHWALSAAPGLAVATEDAVAGELTDIQSPALTVLFAIVVICAVLLFVYLVTPLLR